MSSFITNLSDISTSVVDGWLTKMVSLPFGRSRWILRYFVLLDTELRYYKDVHSDSASQILNLKSICQVIPASTLHHPFCFRLEPQHYLNDTDKRPWIIECKSETDMEKWISAIQFRIDKYNNNSSCTSPRKALSMESMKSPSSIICTATPPPEVYRMPLLPLRCTNLNEEAQQRQEEKGPLLMRRNKKLAPLTTLDEMEEIAPQISFSSTSTCSSTLPSPTGAVLGPLISPSIIDRYSQYKSSSSSSLPCCSNVSALSPITIGDIKNTCDDEQCSSPTYLMYKKRFRL